ncbi:retrotransposon ORF1 [Tanacetum coccineum]
MHLTKGIANFGNGFITIYPKLDHFLDSSREPEKTDEDWDLLLDDLDFGDILEIKGVEIPPFMCKMGNNSRNKIKQLKKYQLIYSDMGPSLSTEKPLTREEAAREALAIDICKRFSLLEEERPVIETMAYSDKYKKILDEICIDKMKLDGAMKKEEEEINLNALADTGSDVNVMPYCVYKELGREEVKPVNRGITMLNHSKAEPMRLLKDVLCQVGVTTIIAKFVILDMPFKRDTSILVGRGFLYTCGSILNTIERITSTFDGICHQTFCAAKTSLNTKESNSDDEEDYGIQRNNFGATVYGTKPANQAAKSRYNTRLAQLLPRHIYSSCVIDWNVLNHMSCGEVTDEMLTIKFSVAGTDEEIFTSEAWTRAFNIEEPFYSELCHNIYSTYEFDEVYTDDELRTKKIIKFRLCGHAFSWTLLEFAKRLGLYHSDEIDEEGFDVYFQGGLRSDEHFNA